MKNLFALLIFSSTVAQAQLTTQQLLGQINTITTAVPFLRICPDARAGGMGDGGIALANDANAMHWNVSKLAFNEHKFGFSASYTPWLRALVPDVNLFYGAACYKPDSASAIGISARYFNMGYITFTNVTGTVIGQFRPYEYAVDVGYARKLFRGFSVGLTGRYIYSNLTNGVNITNQSVRPADIFAGDLGVTWISTSHTTGKSTIRMISGLTLTNVGNKATYRDTDTVGDFIPINLGIAQGIELDLGQYNEINFQVQFDKLLVPSPPIYELDSATGSPKVVNGQFVILHGEDPNRSVWKGMTGSFSDAPGGAREELREINFNAGAEYVYNKTFKVRAGYFYEHYTKGNRQFLAVGAGVVFHAFTLDFAYLFPTNGQRSPLQNTLRFTLMFSIDKLKITPRGHDTPKSFS
jgi:hypothetical protein